MRIQLGQATRIKREYAQFKANVFVSKSEQEYKIKSSKFKQLDLLDKEKTSNTVNFYSRLD